MKNKLAQSDTLAEAKVLD